jgi:hypothetical protein
LLKNTQPILIYLLIFFAITILLKLFGIIDVSNAELFGYLLIFYGITLVYTSFGKGQPFILMLGSSLFLTGFLLILINYFEFNNKSEIIFPSILMILGIDFLMLFLDNRLKKNYLAISATCLLSAVVVIVMLGSVTASGFFSALGYVAVRYWPVIIIAAGLILLLNLEHKNK